MLYRASVVVGEIIMFSAAIWFAILFFSVGVQAEEISPFCRHTTKELRSRAVLKRFDRVTGYPRGRKGYIRDHICPLACGGPDAVSNLQWQTIKESREKDKIERSPLGYSLFCSRTFSQYGTEK